MPAIQEKICVLKVIEATPLQLAKVRSLLIEFVYVEIESQFIISCTKVFKDSLAKTLKKDGATFVLIYINLKTGCDVKSNGINNSDNQSIRSIILDI